MHVEDIPERFFIDIAVGVYPFEDICKMYELDPDLAEDLEDDPVFVKRLKLAQQVVEDDGRAFRSRCRSVVQNSITSMEHLMHDPDTPPSTRLEAFKTLAKFGELEPRRSDENGPTGPQLSLTIIAPDGRNMVQLGAQPAPDYIDVTPEQGVEDDEPAVPAISADKLGFAV